LAFIPATNNSARLKNAIWMFSHFFKACVSVKLRESVSVCNNNSGDYAGYDSDLSSPYNLEPWTYKTLPYHAISRPDTVVVTSYTCIREVPHSNIDSYTESGRFLVCVLIPATQLLRVFFDKAKKSCKISGFRCEVGEIRALLGYYAACSGNSLPTFR
jgi:hypothetical protein